jgi:hypothetical protein
MDVRGNQYLSPSRDSVGEFDEEEIAITLTELMGTNESIRFEEQGPFGPVYKVFPNSSVVYIEIVSLPESR